MEHLKIAQEAMNKLTCICVGLNKCVAELITIEGRHTPSNIDKELDTVLTKMEISVQARKIDLMLDEFSNCTEEFATNLEEYLDAKRAN